MYLHTILGQIVRFLYGANAVSAMYAPTQLFQYKPIFMTELMLAQALFAVKLRKRTGFWWRILLSVVLCYGVSFAIPVLGYDALWCSVMFLLMYTATCMFMWFCFDESFINILFCSIAGYTVQHIAYEGYDLFSSLLGISSGDVYSDMLAGTVYMPFSAPLSMLLYLGTFVVVYWTCYMAFARGIKKDVQLQLKSKNVMVLIAIVVIADIVLSSCVTYYSYKHADKFYKCMLAVFNILLCSVLLVHQFELPVRRELERELDTVYELLELERKQYFAVKSNIELVNRQCHDLKYKIRQIGDSGKVGDDTLREIEDAISIYGTTVKTDNDALNTILTEKSLFCYRNGINLSVMADGKSLSFMRDADIYVLFGNAVDNAVEAVTDLPDDKKVIGVSVKRVNGFLAVNIHNYYDHDIVMLEGVPQTTKTDRMRHGYGMSSMRAICDKYNGDMVVRAENNVFTLNLIFPLPDKSSI